MNEPIAQRKTEIPEPITAIPVPENRNEAESTPVSVLPVAVVGYACRARLVPAMAVTRQIPKW
jgi:hypothetical protein